jgi:hypothetical protein
VKPSRGSLALAGRREAGLAVLPSVDRLVAVLSERCRDLSWIRTSVASLDRFASLTGCADLEALMAEAQRDPRVAENALDAFATALDAYAPSQIAALALGPKLWFTFNNVPVRWAPLRDGAASGGVSPDHRLVLLAMIGTGLHLTELMRLTLADAGALDADGRLVHDLAAEPLALRYRDIRAAREYVTFLTYDAREALTSDLARRSASGRPIEPQQRLISDAAGHRFNRALIRAGNDANVELCRTTGDFFRAWGRPGSRFVGVEEFSSREFA